MNHFYPLTVERHHNLSIEAQANFDFCQTQQLVPVVASEFIEVSHYAPIVFAKSAATGQFMSVALFGIETGHNDILSDTDNTPNYLPKHIRSYPFRTQVDGEQGVLEILVEEQSPWLNRENKGLPLFERSGQATQTLNSLQQFLLSVVHDEQRTMEFINALIALNLLSPLALTITLRGQKQQLNGLYSINQEHLAGLTQSQNDTLNDMNYRPAIAAQLRSLEHIQSLLNLAAKRHAQQEQR